MTNARHLTATAAALVLIAQGAGAETLTVKVDGETKAFTDKISSRADVGGAAAVESDEDTKAPPVDETTISVSPGAGARIIVKSGITWF